MTASQEGGSPLYIVFTKPEYEIERERIRRGPAGPYTLFDSYGYIIPGFASANLVDHESEVFPYSPSGKIAIASVFGVSSGSAFDEGRWSVQTLNIVPATAVQTSALSVVLGPPAFGFDDQCAGDFWSWRHDDADVTDGQRFTLDREQTLTEISRRLRRSAGRAPKGGSWGQAGASESSSSSFGPVTAMRWTRTPRPGGTCRTSALVTGCRGANRSRATTLLTRPVATSARAEP